MQHGAATCRPVAVTGPVSLSAAARSEQPAGRPPRPAAHDSRRAAACAGHQPPAPPSPEPRLTLVDTGSGWCPPRRSPERRLPGRAAGSVCVCVCVCVFCMCFLWGCVCLLLYVFSVGVCSRDRERCRGGWKCGVSLWPPQGVAIG